MPTPTATDPTPPNNPNDIFEEDGPFNPSFMHEAVRTLMRALPLDDPDEPRADSHRRMHAAMLGLAALHPRDEIEVMLGVQALAAYHAAAANWRIGMNLRHPRGDSTRHITTAASAARTFDTLLRALERRQAKPLTTPIGRPPCREWPKINPSAVIQNWEDRCRHVDQDLDPQAAMDIEAQTTWTPEALAIAHENMEKERIEAENEGLDIANTDGILPGGGMIVPEEPTPQQEAYIARRLVLMYKREILENRRNGITKMPKIRPLRTGDRVP